MEYRQHERGELTLRVVHLQAKLTLRVELIGEENTLGGGLWDANVGTCEPLVTSLGMVATRFKHTGDLTYDNDELVPKGRTMDDCITGPSDGLDQVA
jgi:hypothetical protein